MRHRQTSGTGSSGARPGIVVCLLTVLGALLAVAVHGSAGLEAGYAVATAAALIGGGTLWRQRGLLEQRVGEMARRRRADLAQATEAELRYRAEANRLRAELDHEQQYSTLVQGQLSRARRQVEDERTARRAAERELDALNGWEGSADSLVVADETADPAPVAYDDEPDDSGRAHSDRAYSNPGRLYRPFVERQTAAVTGSVSEAALAMAPVIDPVPAAAAVLDLTAYDETLEFSLRDLRGGVA